MTTGVNNGKSSKKEANRAGELRRESRRLFHLPTPLLGFSFPPTSRLQICTTISPVCFILRKLSHPHIVKFYGTSLRQQQTTVRLVLVFERCKGNLKDHIFNNQELIPGKSRRREATKKVFQWTKEITDALAYIHEQRIVHRDLKLENVLVRCNVLFVCSELNRPSSSARMFLILWISSWQQNHSWFIQWINQKNLVLRVPFELI